MFTSTDKRRYYHKGESHNMSLVIDGIIGAGKSSVGVFLSHALDMPMFEELKSDGSNHLAQRMLDRFYADQSRWSAIIQVMFLNDRFRDIKTIESQGIPSIIDRSIYGDEIFARTIHDRGNMTKDEFDIYKDLLHNMLEHISPPTLLIYIDVSVDTAMARINKRARSTEADAIPRDYMEDLRRNYEAWFEAYSLSPKLRIDLNDSLFLESGQIREEKKAAILAAINPYL
jgi:deoxyadenosine/deoxycytidine kinase